MDYQKILDQLADGELKEYEVEAKSAFEFQKALRNYGRRQSISGRAKSGGNIVYYNVNGAD